MLIYFRAAPEDLKTPKHHARIATLFLGIKKPRIKLIIRGLFFLVIYLLAFFIDPLACKLFSQYLNVSLILLSLIKEPTFNIVSKLLSEMFE